jgi:DNA-binding transcriptional regulator YbjK
VGKGEEMSSVESSHLEDLTDEEDAEGRPHSEEYSRGVVSHVNEDDEKLRTSTIKDMDQRIVLII